MNKTEIKQKVQAILKVLLEKMTRAEIADRIGVRYHAIYTWERGFFCPNTEHLEKLSQILIEESKK